MNWPFKEKLYHANYHIWAVVPATFQFWFGLHTLWHRNLASKTCKAEGNGDNSSGSFYIIHIYIFRPITLLHYCAAVCIAYILVFRTKTTAPPPLRQPFSKIYHPLSTPLVAAPLSPFIPSTPPPEFPRRFQFKAFLFWICKQGLSCGYIGHPIWEIHTNTHTCTHTHTH